MATQIILSDKAKAVHDGYSWSPTLFREGGKEYRNIQTGEAAYTEDKWERHDVYFHELKAAIKYIAKEQCLEKEEYKSVKEYMEAYEKAVNKLLQGLPA